MSEKEPTDNPPLVDPQPVRTQIQFFKDESMRIIVFEKTLKAATKEKQIEYLIQVNIINAETTKKREDALLEEIRLLKAMNKSMVAEQLQIRQNVLKAINVEIMR